MLCESDGMKYLIESTLWCYINFYTDTVRVVNVRSSY